MLRHWCYSCTHATAHFNTHALPEPTHKRVSGVLFALLLISRAAWETSPYQHMSVSRSSAVSNTSRTFRLEWFIWVYSHSPCRHALYQFYTWGSLYSSRRAPLSLSNSCMRSPCLWGSFQKLKLASSVFCTHMEDSKSVHGSPGCVVLAIAGPRGITFSGGLCISREHVVSVPVLVWSQSLFYLHILWGESDQLIPYSSISDHNVPMIMINKS